MRTEKYQGALRISRKTEMYSEALDTEMHWEYIEVLGGTENYGDVLKSAAKYQDTRKSI